MSKKRCVPLLGCIADDFTGATDLERHALPPVRMRSTSTALSSARLPGTRARQSW